MKTLDAMRHLDVILKRAYRVLAFSYPEPVSIPHLASALQCGDWYAMQLLRVLESRRWATIQKDNLKGWPPEGFREAAPSCAGNGAWPPEGFRYAGKGYQS